MGYYIGADMLLIFGKSENYLTDLKSEMSRHAQRVARCRFVPD
jgi:hypothetical protein